MKEKVNVTGVPETMVQTLYARAKETRKKNAKINDEIAVELVKIPIVEESLMHMIYTGFFSSVFQIIEHDIDRETAKKNVHQLKEFNTGGWERLWNIEFPV